MQPPLKTTRPFLGYYRTSADALGFVFRLQAKKKEALLASLPPTNEAIDAAILREKLFERDSLKATCKLLDLDIYEVSTSDAREWWRD